MQDFANTQAHVTQRHAGAVLGESANPYDPLRLENIDNAAQMRITGGVEWYTLIGR